MKVFKFTNTIVNNDFFSRDAIKEDNEIDTTALVDAVLKECRKDEVTYKNHSLKALGEIVSALEIDRFEDIYNIIRGILNDEISTVDDEDSSKENASKNRENYIKLKETAYETLGQAWPRYSKSTQEKYRESFVEQIVQYLPTVTRSAQVCLLSALSAYVDKLSLLTEDNLTDADKTSLSKIVDNILKAVTYAMSISKHTRLRKEALNVIFSLGTKLKKSQAPEYDVLGRSFGEILPSFESDTQPEIKSRVNDIKKLLSDQ